jgi:hypothetical protein
LNNAPKTLVNLLCQRIIIPDSLQHIIDQTQEYIPVTDRKTQWEKAGFVFDLKTVKRIKDTPLSLTSGYNKRRSKRRH